MVWDGDFEKKKLFCYNTFCIVPHCHLSHGDTDLRVRVVENCIPWKIKMGYNARLNAPILLRSTLTLYVQSLLPQ